VRILIAEDDLVSRRVLELTLKNWGHEVAVTCDGNEAWEELRRPGAPALAILDWMMPGIDGPTLCRKVRSELAGRPAYLILLTARGGKEDLIEGLRSGANDYVTKPFDRAELQARVQVGCGVVELQTALAERVQALEAAFAQVKQLQGLLPICCYCKCVRDDKNYWQQVETYVAHHTNARFSHGICPTCFDSVVKPQLAAAT
jgi:phosphoserine phosphatase RsbU/P